MALETNDFEPKQLSQVTDMRTNNSTKKLDPFMTNYKFNLLPTRKVYKVSSGSSLRVLIWILDCVFYCKIKRLTLANTVLTACKFSQKIY